MVQYVSCVVGDRGCCGLIALMLVCLILRCLSLRCVLLIVTVNSVAYALYCLSLAFTCGMICWGVAFVCCVVVPGGWLFV